MYYETVHFVINNFTMQPDQQKLITLFMDYGLGVGLLARGYCLIFMTGKIIVQDARRAISRELDITVENIARKSYFKYAAFIVLFSINAR